MNSDNNSSSSSSGFFDFIVNDFVDWNESVNQRNKEEEIVEEAITSAIVPLVTSSFMVPPLPKKKREFIMRPREEAHDGLFNDYFSEQPLYNEAMFRRRFRMHKHVFLRIVNCLAENDLYFQQRVDATGRVGLSAIQKCTAALRQLAYGTASDACDEYLKVAASTARECLVHFVDGVINQFGPQYLRRADSNDINRLLAESERRGFPGMIGSIDCMHWEWKNCPRAWKGMYQGRSKTATIILEAVASYDLWIWHAFFGTPGSCNDINVLQRSPIFDDICEGRAPEVSYVVNGNRYNLAYYLTDGIYPKWATFIPAIRLPQTAKQRLFTEHQEGVRKDVERAFGVLQARFAIIRNPSLAWSTNILWKIMMACIIMHNMIVEDERDTYQNYQDPQQFIVDELQDEVGSSDNSDNRNFNVRAGRLNGLSLAGYMANRGNVRDKEAHIALKNDLVQHVWNHFNQDPNNRNM